MTLANKGTNLCITDSSSLSDIKNKLDTNINIIKTVQALILIIDFTTPECVKNLILSLQPIKSMHKHFKLPSYEPAKFIIQLEEAKEINYQEIEVDKENAKSKKIKNEFDETQERSQKEEKAQINYQTDLINTPSEELMLNPEVMQAVIPIFILLFEQLYSQKAQQQNNLINENDYNQYNNDYKLEPTSYNIDNSDVLLFGDSNQAMIDVF